MINSNKYLTDNLVFLMIEAIYTLKGVGQKKSKRLYQLTNFW